jgi:hypothetical protein
MKMLRRMNICFWLVFLVIASVLPIAASDLSINFESPAYTVGTINGQNGWVVDAGSVSITDVNPISGSQSAMTTSDSAYASHVLAGQTFQDGTSMEFLIQSDSENWIDMWDAYSRKLFALKFAPYQNVLRAFHTGGDGYTTLGGMTANNTYKINVVFDFTNDTFDVRAENMTNSQPIMTAAGLGFIWVTTEADASGGFLRYWGNNQSRLDNLNFQQPAVPEPGSLLALGSGLVGFAGFLVRRRK